METASGFAIGQAAKRAGARQRTFDWVKAAKILTEGRPDEAFAGLSDDLEWTSGIIWTRDGIPPQDDFAGLYLSSNWAVPVLIIDDEEIACWVYEDESPGWGSDTYWPDEAVQIVQSSV